MAFNLLPEYDMNTEEPNTKYNSSDVNPNIDDCKAMDFLKIETNQDTECNNQNNFNSKYEIDKEIRPNFYRIEKNSKDDDVLFLESLLPHIKQLRGPERLLCRMSILKVVYDHLEANNDYNLKHKNTNNDNCSIKTELNQEDSN